MVELTSVLSAVMGLGAIYWLLAFAAVGAAAYLPQSRHRKVTAVAVVTLLFWLLPAKLSYDAFVHARYARAAWAHFKTLCAEKAGDKIFKAYANVQSALILRPLPSATEKDNFDQYWYGDPYSAPALNDRGELGAVRLTGTFKSNSGDQPGLEFVEIMSEGPRKAHYQLSRSAVYPYLIRREIDQVTSKFGVLWEDISTVEDRSYWVAGSRLRILDLSDNSVVADRIGYMIESGFGSKANQRRPWLASRRPTTTCPPISNGDYEDRWFVLKVLRPLEGVGNGK